MQLANLLKLAETIYKRSLLIQFLDRQFFEIESASYMRVNTVHSSISNSINPSTFFIPFPLLENTEVKSSNHSNA